MKKFVIDENHDENDDETMSKATNIIRNVDGLEVTDCGLRVAGCGFAGCGLRV